jgi:hypothetical protein
MRGMSHTPAPRADGIATIDYCARLPRRRYSHEARGLVLLMPRTGLTGVPSRAVRHEGRVWAVAAEPVPWFTRDA